MIDSHDTLIVHVDRRGLFGGEGHVLAGIFDGEQNRLVSSMLSLTARRSARWWPTGSARLTKAIVATQRHASQVAGLLVRNVVSE